MLSNVIEVLKERSLLDQVANEKLKVPSNLYIGFDPTFKSLHLGNLIGIIVAEWFKRFSFTPYMLIGEATAKIGDPSGKAKERPLLDEEVISKNVISIKNQITSILQRTPGTFNIINNNDWLKEMSIIDFLKIGRNFRLGTMLAKESVKVRLNSEVGLSFTEFSYQILQAYDFYYLFSNNNIALQIGGSDQWGNITAGIDLVKKITSKQVAALTFPLMIRSDGKKFGKTEKGAIWLDSELLSYFEFYQYFFRLPDEDVVGFLKKLTFLDILEIQKIEKSMSSADYVPNTAQKILATEVTKFVHGEDGMKIAMDVSKKIKPGSLIKDLTKEQLEAIKKDMPSLNLSFEEIVDVKFIELMVRTNLVKSKSEATRLIKNNGAYLNNEKVNDEALIIKESNLISKKYILLGAGKKKKMLIYIN